MNEVTTLDLREILDSVYPTVPGGIKRLNGLEKFFRIS